MRRTLCALILLLGAPLALGAATEPSRQMPADAGPWVVRAYFDNKAQLNLAARRSPPWEVNHAQRVAVLEVANRFEYSQLLAQGFRIGVDADLTLLLRDPAAALRTVPGFGCYRTVEETLASIDQLILTDPPRASRMQQSLIMYLRAAMPQMRASGNGARPTLGQQVDLSRAFLDIMAVRMDERLQPAVSVPDGLRSAVFPSMMLQTLVENAIRHGLEPKAEGGKVEIRAEIEDGSLAVRVCDTGVGFNFNKQGGVGLANIRERLKVMYRDRAELVISVPSEGGTCATIRIPYEVAPSPAA